MSSGPLDDVIVLDMSQAVTGPYAAWLMQGLGARIVKLEGPGGDLSRVTTPRFPGISPLFTLYNGGKESVCVNLKNQKGREVFLDLASKVDAIIENFVPGTMEAWELTWDVLSARNPRLIYASITGFGRESKYARAHAFDMVIQAMSGVMAATGQPDDPPTMAGVMFMDTIASPHLVAGIVAALYERQHSGKGKRVEVAMRDVAACIPFNLYNVYYNAGRAPRRLGNAIAGFSPGNAYPTTDGYAYVATNSDKQAEAVFGVIGRQELVGAPGYATVTERWPKRHEIDRIVEEWTSKRTKREVFEQMTAAAVPCGMVLDIEEVMNDEDLMNRGVFADVDQPGIGHLKLPRSPIVLNDRRSPALPAAMLGRDTERILKEFLDYDDWKLSQLIQAGAIGAS